VACPGRPWENALVMRVLVLIVLCGCWRDAAPATPIEPAPSPSGSTRSSRPVGSRCGAASTNIRAVVRESSLSIAARADDVADVIHRRCTEDLWSPELIDCLARVATIEDADDCEPLATPEQSKAINDDIDQLESGN
jgi:hypothetical protein